MHESRPPGSFSPTPPMSIKPPAPKNPAVIGDEVDESSSIGLVETSRGGDGGASKIKALGAMGQQHSDAFQRPTNVTKTGACRVKTFIGKLSTQGMDYMDHSINVWLDHHPDVEVKFVTTTFGQLDGKVERAMVTSLWY